MSYYTYRIRIANRDNVQVEARAPDNELMGEPAGIFGYTGKIKTRIQELHQAGYAGTLNDAGVQELGEALFSVLFDAALSRDFFGLYERARRQDILLRIELDVDERQLPDVAALPWEFMRVPPSAGYGTVWLSTAPNIVFSRRRALWRPAEPIQLQAGERLRIALAVAAPQGITPIKYEKVSQTLQKLAADQADRIQLLEMANPATTVSIDAVLEQEPHIFHFIGHARLKDENQQDSGQIALVDDILDEPMWIGAERFSELFNRHQPGVIVLDACEGAAMSASQAFVGVASHVIQQNIPVVVAMQYEVSNSTAHRFAIAFYKRLAQDDPVDKAAQEGRRSISLGPVGYSMRDFATPVLFMRVRDGHLFQRPSDASSLQRDKDTPAIAKPVDRSKLHDILDTFFSDADLRLLCFKLKIDYENLPGEGKASKARELILYWERRQGTDPLVAAAYKMRPEAPWWD